MKSLDRARRSLGGQPLAILLLIIGSVVAPALPTSALIAPLYTSSPSASPLFANVTARAGVQATESLLTAGGLSAEGDGGFLNGGRGPCVADFDGDGDDDLYVNGPGKNQMFRNDGNFTFKDVTDSAGVGDTGYGMGCAAGDLDNDGDEDIIATNWYSPFTIYRNNGNLSFSNMTATSGISDAGPQTGVSLGDFDNDGLLDFFMTEYNKVNDRVYRNDGGFKFTDQTLEARIQDQAYGFQPISADYDADGDLDVYVVNDIGNDTLWQNDGQFHFTDVSRVSGAQDPGDGMGGAWGDFDSDGDLDIHTTNLGLDALWENRATSFFDVGNASGVDDGWVGWGVVWFDYDNDGHLDLYVANSPVMVGSEWNQPSKLFHNLGNKTFADVSQGSGAENGELSRGVAVGDFDQDGMVDLYVMNINCPAMLFENVVANTNTWLRVKLEGTRSNRDGVGATISVAHGNQKETQVVAAGSSYLSSNSRVLNFGLREASVATEVVVKWPSGLRQVITNVTVNQTLVVTESDETDPIAVAPPIVVRQGEEFVLNGSGSSDNVRVVGWNWTVDLNGTNKTAQGAVATMTVYTPGVFQGRLEVRDLFGRVGVALFSVTVLEYRAVWVEAGPDFSVAEGATVTFAARGWSTATPDFEADCLFEWWFDTPSGRVNLSGPRPTFAFADPAQFTVFVRVTDPQNATGNDSVRVTVLDAKLPVVVAVVPTAVDEDVAVRLDASASTDNDPTFPGSGMFFWNYTGPAGPVSWSGMTVDARFQDPGVFTLRLSVSDQVGNAAVQLFSVAVRDNTSPVPNAGPDRTTRPGRDVAFTASGATDNDPTFQQTGRFVWTLHLREGPLVLTGHSVVYALEDPGTFHVDLDAWDATGNHAAAVDTALVLVEDLANPIPFGGGDRTVVVLEPFPLNASGTTDNDPMILETGTFLWEFQDGSVRVLLHGVLANYTFARAGTYTVRLTVKDAAGNAAAVTFTVKAKDLDPPAIVVDKRPTEVFPGDAVELNASGSTDNVGIASISWRVQGPFLFDAQGYGAVATVRLNLVGTYTATVTAKDSAGNVANLSWEIRVVPRPSTGTGNGTIPDSGTTPVNGTPEGSPPTQDRRSPGIDAPALLAALGVSALLLASRRRRR